ncbi:MAG: tRNA lysidine(34) synthetase TilS [Saprospiraceae bacterium]|nr:tRNA lysidine(34) synthetase TilS [Saprospiraceae bacterium]
MRHHVVPVFEQINPAFQKVAGENIERLGEAEQLYDFALQKITDDVVEKGSHEWRIDLRKLRSCPAPITVLFELLKPHGFNNDQVKNILQSAESQPGSIFDAPPARLLVDRFFLILSLWENVGGEVEISVISAEPIELPGGARLTISYPAEPPPTLAVGANTAWLDGDKLQFPLKLRHWQAGDWFCPLGMGGKRQKLQDFFSNNKLSRFEKDKVWLLETGGNIAWVVGMRLDERFKVMAATKSFLRLDFQAAQSVPNNL